MKARRVIASGLAAALAGPVPTHAHKVTPPKPPHSQPSQDARARVQEGVHYHPPGPRTPGSGQLMQPQGPSGVPAAQPAEPLETRAFRLTQDHPLARLALEAADRWKVGVWLLWALLWAESRWDCTLVNKRSHAAGCGQFTRSGISGLNRIRAARGDDRPFTRADALDPREGVHATAELLAYLTARYGVRGGVAAYNGGRHKRWFAGHVLRRMRALRLEAGLPPVELRTLAVEPTS